MKYIRTENGIRPICGKNHITNTVSFYDKHGRLFSAIVEDSRIADTIEELCDEFVIIYNESKKFTKPFTSAYSDIKDVLKEHDINECKVYGAIWTDKGLIYVAKMNDKGELELL